MDREKYARALRKRLERRQQELDQQITPNGDLYTNLSLAGKAGGVEEVIHLLSWFDSWTAHQELHGENPPPAAPATTEPLT